MKLNNDLCIISASSSAALPILATRVNDRDSRRCSVIVGWQIFSPPSFTKKNEEGISILAPTSPSSPPSSVSFVVVVAFVVCSAHFSLTAAAAAAAKRAVVVPPPPYHPCLSLSLRSRQNRDNICAILECFSSRMPFRSWRLVGDLNTVRKAGEE